MNLPVFGTAERGPSLFSLAARSKTTVVEVTRKATNRFLVILPKVKLMGFSDPSSQHCTGSYTVCLGPAEMLYTRVGIGVVLLFLRP